MTRKFTIAALVVLLSACHHQETTTEPAGVAFERARIRLEPSFSEIDSFSAEGLARASAYTDSSTYIDSTGKQLIPYKYNVQRFYEGFGLVEEGEKGPFYYIDKTGKKVLDLPGYTNAFSFFDGYAVVANKDGLYGVIDKMGKEVIPCTYDEGPDELRKDIFIVHPVDKPKQLLGLNGVTLPAITEFDALYYDTLHNTYAMESKDGWFLLNDKGTVLKKIDADGVQAPRYGVYLVNKTPEGKGTQNAVMDGTGNMIVPYGKYDNIETYSEGFASVGVETGTSPDNEQPGASIIHQKTGYIDATGKEVIPLQFEDIMPAFNEGLAQALLKGKMGYIDKTGKWVIQPQFDKAQPFSHGFAKVTLNGNAWYIDTKGNKLQ